MRRSSDIVDPVIRHRVDKELAIEDVKALLEYHTTVTVTRIMPGYGKPYFLVTTKG